MPSTSKHSHANGSAEAEDYSVGLERATRGLLALNVSVLEQMEISVGLAPLRALQSLDRRGPSMVGELGDDLGLVPSTASRLSDRLAEAGLITRRPAPSNRRSTLLELTDAGRAILDELVALRLRVFGEVADQMSKQDRAALLRGAHAFTVAQQRLADKSTKQRAESRRASDKP
ncbi:MarR family transcriptional regulator [Mycolicibacterium sp. P9-64]|uniref:MarR family winged helix-turn-helix transcriptional regulator n=1 Tax=Mycolicibacterium sp. P9-64 TaxID=2024612 RepID=UPI0011EEEB1C|nr:MarR family transcriptional regulator [Mycolicibacterium sp. P9-64]KAA0084511.1 MarR family transcriptional regulator [Mycolicibacterium sp. P9-64]